MTESQKYVDLMERLKQAENSDNEKADDRLALTTGSARVLPHELDLKAGEIMARCWKCFRLCAFTGCHTYTRHPHHGGATIIFQPDRYYAACPNCDAVQMQAIPPQNVPAMASADEKTSPKETTL